MELQEYRCDLCHKLLFKGILIESVIEVKCKRCHNITSFKGHQESEFVCLNSPHCPHRITTADHA